MNSRDFFRLSLVAISFTIVSSSCAQKSGQTSGTAPGETQPGQQTGSGTTPGANPVESQNEKVFAKLSSCQSLAELINKYKLPDQAIICTVGNEVIHIGDYKFVLRQRQNRVREFLQLHPEQRIPLVKQAEQLKIDLTDEEKSRLVHDGKAAFGPELGKFLKERKLTEKELEDQILEMGRALKTASRDLEQPLMNELINQALLIDAGRKSGLAKSAFHRYIEFKHGPDFEQLASFSNLSPDQLRDKLIEQFLADLERERIVEQAKIQDSDVLQLYKENQDKFKHHGRLRFAQIVIASPTADLGALESLTHQVERQRPDLKGPALEEEIKATEQRQHDKALKVLSELKSGKDFAGLANETTDDIPARAAKNGGDMGYIPVDDLKRNTLLKPVADELQKLKPGELCQEPVRTQFGWHIIKLIDYQKEGVLPFNEVRDELKKTVARQNSELAVRAWIIEKRKTVPVALNKEFEKTFDQFQGQANTTMSK